MSKIYLIECEGPTDFSTWLFPTAFATRADAEEIALSIAEEQIYINFLYSIYLNNIPTSFDIKTNKFNNSPIEKFYKQYSYYLKSSNKQTIQGYMLCYNGTKYNIKEMELAQ